MASKLLDQALFLFSESLKSMAYVVISDHAAFPIIFSWKKIKCLTLNAPITTKVVCFSHLLKCSRSLYGKQCEPRSDCSYRSSLFWVHAVCSYTKFVSNARQLFAADDFSRRHFQMHLTTFSDAFFSWRFKG